MLHCLYQEKNKYIHPILYKDTKGYIYTVQKNAVEPHRVLWKMT